VRRFGLESRCRRRLALTPARRALLVAAPIWKRTHAAMEHKLKRGADALRSDLVALS